MCLTEWKNEIVTFFVFSPIVNHKTMQYMMRNGFEWKIIDFFSLLLLFYVLSALYYIVNTQMIFQLLKMQT